MMIDKRTTGMLRSSTVPSACPSLWVREEVGASPEQPGGEVPHFFVPVGCANLLSNLLFYHIGALNWRRFYFRLQYLAALP